MKTVLAILVMLMLSTAAHARQRAFGYCEDGGQASVTNGIYSSGTVSLLGGNTAFGTGIQASYPVCTVTVYIAGTLTPAVVYSDNSGTTLTNPFPAANDGYWFFYADDGKYDVRFSGGGIPSPFTRPDYLLCDGCNSGGGGAGVQLTPLGSQVIVQPPSTVLSVNRLEGIRFADQFASISAAVTDAGTTGSVIVPPGYTLPDTYNPPLAAPILDFRNNTNLYAGNGQSGSAVGGNLGVGAGQGGNAAAGGNATISGGPGGATSGAGGDVILQPGSGQAAPGNITLKSGTGTATATSVVKADAPIAIGIVNDAVTGTTADGLVSLTGGTAVRTASGATSGVVGVCLFNCGKAGVAYVAQLGNVPVLLDNAGTPGDYVCPSSSTNAYGTDCGSSPPANQTIGRVKSNISGNVYSIILSVGGGSSGAPSGAVVLTPSASQIIVPSTAVAIPLGMQCGTTATGGQVCFFVQSNSGSNLVQVLNSGNVIFGSGSGGTIQTGGVQVAETAVSFSASPSFNLTLGDTFIISLTGNVTSSTLSNMPASGFAQRATFIVCQDGAGGHSFVWPTVMRGAMTVGVAPSLCSVQTFVVDSTLARATDTGVVNQ